MATSVVVLLLRSEIVQLFLFSAKVVDLEKESLVRRNLKVTTKKPVCGLYPRLSSLYFAILVERESTGTGLRFSGPRFQRKLLISNSDFSTNFLWHF